MTTMQQRPRDGFASLENLAAALAVDFSDSSELRTSTVSSLSNFASEADDVQDIARHGYERKTSRFMEATFRESTGSKDDMAMPTHHHHRKSLLGSHSNKSKDTESKNNSEKHKSRQNQKRSSKSKERRKLYSADDSNVGNFASGLLPKLRPRAAKDRKQKSKGTQKKDEGSNNTLSTTKSDLSQSLVGKLGKSPLESHNRNKAVSRRRASVQATSVSSHQSQSSQQSADDSKEKPRPRRGQSVDAMDRKNRRKAAEEEKKESKTGIENSKVEEQNKVRTEIHIKFKHRGASGERHELPSDLCKPRSRSPKKSDNKNNSQKHHRGGDDSSKRRQAVDTTTTKSGSRRHVGDESSKNRPTVTGDESSRRHGHDESSRRHGRDESSRRHGRDESSRRHGRDESSRRHDESSRRRQTSGDDESGKRHHGDESSRRHGDDKKSDGSRHNHHSRREESKSLEKRKQSKDRHDSNHRDHSRDKRGRDSNSRSENDKHGRRHRSHSVSRRSSEHKRTRDSHSHGPKGESRRHKDGQKEDSRRGDSHRPRDEHKRNKSRSSAERSRRHRGGDSHSLPELQKRDENDHAEALEVAPPTSQRRRTRGSMILPATSGHNPETQNQEKPEEKGSAENNPTNGSQNPEKSEEKVPAEKTTPRRTRGSIMVIQTPEDARAVHEKPRHRRRDDLHGRSGRPIEDRHHHPMEGVGRTERRKQGKKRPKLKRFKSKSTSDLLSKTSSRHQERSGKAGKSKAGLPKPKKISGRSSTTGHIPSDAPSSGSRKNKIASGKKGENSSRGRRHSVGSSGTKEKASSRGRRPASSSVSPPRGRSGLPAPNDQTAHKLTLDTGRRRSISPKRNREKLTKENSISRSRFREALMKQESEQQWEELVAPKPTIRRHSSLSKLETRSRNSLLMHHSHESPSQEEGQHLLLSRSRMGFLDASIPFSDSEDEGEKRSVHQERLVRSIHNHMYSTSESSDDEEHNSPPEFDVTDEGPNDVSLEPPSFHQHPSMAGNLNRVDLTALSGSQVQVVLARAAMNEDS